MIPVDIVRRWLLRGFAAIAAITTLLVISGCECRSLRFAMGALIVLYWPMVLTAFLIIAFGLLIYAAVSFWLSPMRPLRKRRQ